MYGLNIFSFQHHFAVSQRLEECASKTKRRCILQSTRETRWESPTIAALPQGACRVGLRYPRRLHHQDSTLTREADRGPRLTYVFLAELRESLLMYTSVVQDKRLCPPKNPITPETHTVTSALRHTCISSTREEGCSHSEEVTTGRHGISTLSRITHSKRIHRTRCEWQDTVTL